MQIVNFGHFKVTSDIDSEDYDGFVYYANEDGLDWYELRARLTSWTVDRGRFVDAVFGAWTTVDPVDGVVINVEFNPSKLVPDNRIVLGIDAHHMDIAKGMIWDGEKLLPPTEASLERIGPPL